MVRRLEEVVDQLENWFALRNSVELDDLCLEVGLSRRQVHAWLRRRRTSQPQAQAVDVKSTSPASNIEVIALEEDSDEDEKQVNVGVKQGKEGGKDYKKLYEEKCEELMVQSENLKNYENIMIDVEK